MKLEIHDSGEECLRPEDLEEWDNLTNRERQEADQKAHGGCAICRTVWNRHWARQEDPAQSPNEP